MHEILPTIKHQAQQCSSPNPHMWCFLLLVFISQFATINGQVFYVNSNSTATENCGGIENPCVTISSGIKEACSFQNQNQSAVTVIVYPGNYNNTITIYCPLALM